MRTNPASLSLLSFVSLFLLPGRLFLLPAVNCSACLLQIRASICGSVYTHHCIIPAEQDYCMVAARGRALCRWLHAGQGQVIPAWRIRPSPAAPRGVRCSSGAGLATAAGRRRRCRRPRKQQLSGEGPSIRGSRIPRTAQLGPIISKPFSSARSRR